MAFARLSKPAGALRYYRKPLTLHRFPGIRPISTTSNTSNLPLPLQQEILRENTLPNADPSTDSASAALVAQHAPYMVATYVRPPPVFVRGLGAHVWDIEGRRFVDFTAGIAVNSLGHGDAGICEILYDQAKQIIHTSNLYHNPWTGELSKLLVERTRSSGGFHTASRVFICNSGSEANEAALKFARKIGKLGSNNNGTKKTGLVSFYNSFHGRTMGSLSATPNPKYQEPFAPMVPGFKYGIYNDIAGINDLVTEETCGVIIEPIQGEGGVFTATPEFLLALRKRCNQVNAVLIYDEIQCGLGRTGELWAHGVLPKEAHPDILTMAKALGNGFPIAATMVSENVAEKIVAGDHGTTFGGNPLACRVGHYVFSKLSERTLLDGVKRKSEIFKKHLEELRQKFPETVVEVRGRGLILGLQISRDPAGLVKECRERGLLVITAGVDVVRFVPPLVIEDGVIEDGMRVLGEALEVFSQRG